MRYVLLTEQTHFPCIQIHPYWYLNIFLYHPSETLFFFFFQDNANPVFHELEHSFYGLSLNEKQPQNECRVFVMSGVL
ncbi:MAG: hypothetical protein K1X92_11625 [Bacteroidia bacterium]|nr:hypothetical protein [Bacteroidia bacterium]